MAENNCESKIHICCASSDAGTQRHPHFRRFFWYMFSFAEIGNTFNPQCKSDQKLFTHLKDERNHLCECACTKLHCVADDVSKSVLHRHLDQRLIPQDVPIVLHQPSRHQLLHFRMDFRIFARATKPSRKKFSSPHRNFREVREREKLR